jgi:poly(3-hydroxybutyrate) depolymerase
MTMRELSSFGRFGVVIGAVALTLGACSSGGSRDTGTAGKTGGGAGASGNAGSGASAGTSGSAGTAVSGTAGGSAGSSGNAGTSGGAGASAGTSGTAGGTAGAGTGGGGVSGTSGTAGGTATAGSGGGGSGATNAMASSGCGMTPPATQTLGQWVDYSEMVPASTITKGNWLMARSYWVWLPTNYDKNHAYPVIFVGPGCGGKGNNSIQPQTATGNDAIIVGLDYNSAATGRDCFMTESFPDPETEYVENTVKLVDNAFCVDKSRRFIEGFSSGSWISYLMGCVDGGPGGLFKGQGNASGEFQGSCPESACKGPTPYMAGHNNPDGNNAYPGGRDHMLKMNQCATPATTMPYDPGPMVKAPAGATVNCVQYMGCKAPTIFCTTTGLGHNDQQMTGISTYGFWKFWMSLP